MTSKRRGTIPWEVVRLRRIDPVTTDLVKKRDGCVKTIIKRRSSSLEIRGWWYSLNWRCILKWGNLRNPCSMF